VVINFAYMGEARTVPIRTKICMVWVAFLT